MYENRESWCIFMVYFFRERDLRGLLSPRFSAYSMDSALSVKKRCVRALEAFTGMSGEPGVPCSV